ncbi:MAG TPA: LPS assembly lipoprotein LptE, partial [Burkholderiales bacterium]|nr:LPS assembly lipoprotein LptE [Burkholderiales bacterium]
MRHALVAVLLLGLAACGFQLRGSARLPFETIYLPNTTSGIALDLKRTIQAGTSTRVVDTPKDAQAVLEFSEETREKEILSLTGAGRVREFRLHYRVRYRVHDGKGHQYVPPTTLAQLRDITFGDSVVLAKESEEQLQYRDMQNDIVAQIM